MLVLGLGGAAISIVSGDLSITISGMSLASIFGIVLNLILPNEEEGKENIVIDENVDKKEITYNKELDKLKEDIKNELTVSLKGEIIEEIKKELNKKKK